MDKTIAYAITTTIALSGWGSQIYTWITSTPKIKGQVLNVMTAQMLNSQQDTPKTCIFVYLYLVNMRKNPVHVLDYELEFDAGHGYEKALRVYGTRNMGEPAFNSDHSEITMPNFTEKLIYSKNAPVEYGVPLHGFAFFATDKPLKDIEKIVKIKVTCIDAFKNKHIIKSNTKDFSNIYLLQDIAGIEIKQKSIPKMAAVNR